MGNEGMRNKKAPLDERGFLVAATGLEPVT
jgi:hypothetical protein